MPSAVPVLFCALAALVVWGGIGWLVARRVFLGSALAWALAPTIGWAVQTSVALALSFGFGSSVVTSLLATGLIAIAAIIGAKREEARQSLQLWPCLGLCLAAGLLALLPMAGDLPKFVQGGVQLAGPIFDHSKAALIDEILRSGVPPGNPVFQEGGGAGNISYYYLWMFSAAQLARLSGASGWEGDIATSWFTAFSSLLLIGGLALHLSQRMSAAWFALLFSMAGSLRPALAWLIGQPELDRILKPRTGLAGWLLQTSWSPHHVMAAGCAVVALLLMVRLAHRPTIAYAVLLALVVSAGFQSSLWVGGFVFGLCSIPATVILLLTMDPARRGTFLAGCIGAALGAICLSLPLIAQQIGVAAHHTGSFPITVSPVPVLGPAVPADWRRIADLPAYWLLLLVIELPVAFIFGGSGFWRLTVSASRAPETEAASRVLAAATIVSLCSSGFLLSTVGDNNDLGWRAILPAVVLLNMAAGVAAAEWLTRRRAFSILALAAMIVLAVPDSVKLITGNIVGNPTGWSRDFKESADMWAAVRRYASPQDRVANNPLFLKYVTPWPINISWALLADRRSCFAGREFAIAFTSLTPEQRKQISDRFIRVFDGTGSPADVTALANDYGCRVAVVTAEDGAWNRDPFAASPLYRLAEAAAGKWRIYVSERPEQ